MERERIFLRHNNSMNISLNDDDVAKIIIKSSKKTTQKASIDRYTGIHVEEIK